MNYKEIKSRDDYMPFIRDESAKILFDICQKEKPKNILEIGTAIGYSALLMLEGAKDAFVTTIEKDNERAQQAMTNFEKNGVKERVNLIVGDAGEVLPQLEDEGKKFDLIFLDGPKGQYLRYLPHLKKMLCKGGLLVADNVLLHGWVKGEEFVKHKHRSMVVNLRKFLKCLEEDHDFDSKLLEIEDGMTISRKK